MGQKLKLEGSEEAKFKKIQIILNQLLRKLPKTTTFATSPIPISFYQATMGTEKLTYMFPINGTIDKFVFYCNKIDKVKEVTISITLGNDNEQISYFFIIKPGRTNIIMKDIAFEIGSRMIITCQHEDPIKNLWIAFPCHIGKNNFNCTKLVIDEIDNNTLIPDKS